jgi:hypothetical protein
MDKMNRHPLEPLMEIYRQKELPSAPANLERNVWRQIRSRTEVAPNLLWQAFFDWILDRRMVTASLIAAVIMGVIFNFKPEPVTARQAMGLQVFGHSSLSELTQSP